MPIAIFKTTTGQGHPFHLVDASPWPLQTSIVLGSAVASFVLTFAKCQGATILFWLALLSLIIHMGMWFSDVVAEGSLNGDHTAIVMRGLVLGMTLFILTEVVFFGFIFWGYLHSSLSPVVELGSLWPPLGIEPLDAKAIPTLNTVLLLSSGVAPAFFLFLYIPIVKSNWITYFIYFNICLWLSYIERVHWVEMGPTGYSRRSIYYTFMVWYCSSTVISARLKDGVKDS